MNKNSMFTNSNSQLLSDDRMKPQTNPQITRAFMAVLMLIIMLRMQFRTVESSIALPGCQDTCGGIPVPYPFGIGPNCSLQGFELSCNMTNDPPGPFFAGNQTVLSISLSLGQARVENPISSQCYNTNNNTVSYIQYYWNLSGSAFRFNNEKNKFTAIGCDTLAYINFGNETDLNWGGCVLSCGSTRSIINGSCSGIGCCQTAIPKETNYYLVRFDRNYNNSDVYNFSRCGYALLMEDDGFVFSSDYITSEKLYQQQMPVVLDWAIGNEACEVAQADRSSYACKSDNSDCVDSTNGPGYFCNCSTGYQGNPYLSGGCQDIDECQTKSTCSGICTNTPGSFICSCPRGQRGNGSSNGFCYKDPGTPLWVKLVIGICVCIVAVLILSSLVYLLRERRKIATIKEKYFQEYGGQLLFHEMRSMQGFAFTIFKEEELREATNNFDEKNMLGEGGNGMVYKGTLTNKEDVAIKKCKTIGERQKKEFGKEILILSQINHKNIVRIIGCCLEVEIPILVYEFISKGTLFDLIHVNHALRISLSTRLRIAQEAAEALAYLHSWASPPIVHRDVKSSNILLDENFMAKVSDFGASVLAPLDEDQFVTLVQGTRGYLDPEYVQTGQLTVKSDVYSFGVVLLELVTRKKAFYLEGPEERSLSSAFLFAMKENKLEEILDDQILNEESMNLIMGVAELARECLNMEGERRPGMREVAERLDRLRKTMKHPWGQDNRDEIEYLLGESSNNLELEMTTYHSLEEKKMLDMECGR